MITTLRKYHRLFLLEAQNTLALRIHPFLQTLVFMVPVVGKILFWKAVYRSSDGDIGGYDEHDMVLYLIAVTLVNELTWAFGADFGENYHGFRSKITTHSERSDAGCLIIVKW